MDSSHATILFSQRVCGVTRAVHLEVVEDLSAC